MRPLRFLVVLALLAGPGCSNDNPVAPGFAPTPDAPDLSCPSSITESGVTGLSRVVHYAPPTPAAGHPPVASSCAPASGTAFPLGETLVTCNARDALGQERTCAFTVTLTALRLTAMTFVAFGDSLTAGENGNAINGPCPSRLRVQCIDVPNAYPTQLARLLRDEFPAQQISVINTGINGRRAEDDVDRLPDVLDEHRPDALLLLHGFNDLLRDGDEAVTEVITALRDQIRIARQAGVASVFVSTLMPPSSGSRMIEPEIIEEVNAGLRQMVPAEGGILVDSYPRFLGREAILIAPDGLHLTPAGYLELAQSFFDVIRARITTSGLSPRR